MKVEMQYRQGIAQALAAAALFGLSTPLAKALAGEISPVLLAGLLYAGSGLGLTLWLLWRRFAGHVSSQAPLNRRDAPWLAGAVLFGGVLGPILLMWGLTQTAASTASLLLNLESVLTAVLAWVVFRENVDVRVFLGMLAIVAGSVLLSWSHAMVTQMPWGSMAIAGACLCWAIDNNFTRPVSGGDPVQIAAIKGGCCWHDQHRHRLQSRFAFAADAVTARHGCSWLRGLWIESGVVRARVATFRHGTHGRVFLDGTVRGRDRRAAVVPGASGSFVLVGRCTHGARRVVAYQ